MVQGGRLADILNQTVPSDRRVAVSRLWPAEKIILIYFAGLLIVYAGWWNRLQDAPVLLVWHIFAVLPVLLVLKSTLPIPRIFRCWYPLPYVAYSYREMALLIPGVWHTNADAKLAEIDYAIWHVHPTVWLERIQTPILTELLQIAYTCFIPAVVLVALLLWKNRKFPEFQYYAFLITLGYLISYLGYIFVPARGPRFELQPLQHVPLEGLWFFHYMQSGLDTLEKAHFDCFPSGHTELTILAWWGSRLVSKRLFKIYFAYTPFLIFATVYLRYHYTVDVFAGAVVAAVLIWSSPALYRKLSKGSFAIGRN
jgi:membrane-associated phospholipid phosphatase